MPKKALTMPMTSSMSAPLSRQVLPKKGMTFQGGGRMVQPVVGGASNTTMIGLVIVILGLIGLIYYLISINMKNMRPSQSMNTNTNTNANANTSLLPNMLIAPISTRTDTFRDPYSPPLKEDGMYFPSDSTDTRGVPMIMSESAGPSRCNSNTCAGAVSLGVPVNMKTRGFSPEVTQMGILTYERNKRGDDNNSLRDNMILPLFGRRVMNGRDKYQYYTMSNTGAVNTKLPIKVRGRHCSGEYGCDELMNGDVVYVDGYNESFRATVYENSSFSYIPYL